CFFQAEDGIRDFHVTGVQTCALPILDGLAPVAGSCPGAAVSHAAVSGGAAAQCGGAALPPSDGATLSGPGAGPGRRPLVVQRTRSEERRVGNAWRERGWRYHEQLVR